MHVDLEVVGRPHARGEERAGRVEARRGVDAVDRDGAGDLERAAGVHALEDEERPQRDDEARQLGLDDGVAVDEPDRHAEQQHDGDRRPHVPVGARGQESEQQARGADHHAGREIELAADHEQRHGNRDDPVLRRLIHPLARDAEIREPVHVARRVGEQEEHRDGAAERADVGARDEARDDVDPREPFVAGGGGCGCCGHVTASVPRAGWQLCHPALVGC